MEGLYSPYRLRNQTYKSRVPAPLCQRTQARTSHSSMSMPEYESYLIPDSLSKCDNVFKELVMAKTYDEAKVDPETVNIIRLICSNFGDDDVLRIMRLEQWKMEYETGKDYWRQRALYWSRREALYVIACLRWEFQQCWTMKLSNREHEERTRTTTEEQHAAQDDAEISDSGDADDP